MPLETIQNGRSFYGKDKVYLFYRTLAPAVSMIQRSNDGGLTYGPAKTAGLIGQAGSIDVHQASGTVYISGSSGQVCVGSPPPSGAAWFDRLLIPVTWPRAIRMA